MSPHWPIGAGKPASSQLASASLLPGPKVLVAEAVARRATAQGVGLGSFRYLTIHQR